MSKHPVMPLWTDALVGDTTHLSAAEFGSYLLLLIATWRNNGVPFADDDERIARICRVSIKSWRSSVRGILAEFFDLSHGSWCQKRLSTEWKRVSLREQKWKALSVTGNAAKALKRQQTDLPHGNPYGNPYGLPPIPIEEPSTEDSKIPKPRPRAREAPSAAKNGHPAFEGSVIRLTQTDFDQWAKAFNAIPDLFAELTAIDAKFASEIDAGKVGLQVNWFATASAWLRTKHERLLAKNPPAKPFIPDIAEADRPWNDFGDGGSWPTEGQWRRRLAANKSGKRIWTWDWGAPPDERTCPCPDNILAEYGYTRPPKRKPGPSRLPPHLIEERSK